MGINHDSSPFLFPSYFPSYPSEPTTTPSSSSPPPPAAFCSSQSTSSLDSPYKSSSSSPRKLHSRSSSSHLPPSAFGPCAECKLHNRRCSENICLASFLPPNEVHKFAVVDSVFGSRNVGSFLQQNSSSSYIPLLLLLKDTSQEDGDLSLDPKNNALSETEGHSQLGDCFSFQDKFRIRELIQEFKAHLNSALSDINGDHLAQKLFSSLDKTLSILNWTGLQNPDALIDTASNDPESPIYLCDSPGTESANIDNESSKKRKMTPTLTNHGSGSYDEKRRMTVDQVKPPDKSFQDEYKLEPERKIQFPKDLGLQPRQVAIWSHNSRARLKTKHMEKNYDELQSNHDSPMANSDTFLKEKDKLMKSEVNVLADKLFHKE